MWFELVQIIGGIILSMGNIPQIKQIIKTKSVQDLNVHTAMNTALGILCMEVYAIHLVSKGTGFAFFCTNTVSFALSVIIFILVYKFKKTSKGVKVHV